MLLAPGRTGSSLSPRDEHSYIYLSLVGRVIARKPASVSVSGVTDNNYSSVTAGGGIFGLYDYTTTHTGQTGKNVNSRVPFWRTEE